jgi:hypothetical protein
MAAHKTNIIPKSLSDIYPSNGRPFPVLIIFRTQIASVSVLIYL